MNHDPSPFEVKIAVQHLEARARQSCESRLQWSGRDRETLHVLLAFVALVTAQGKASPS